MTEDGRMKGGRKRLTKKMKSLRKMTTTPTAAKQKNG